MIHVQGCTYELVQDVRNGWNVEAFKERYSEVLSKYDYIVGDWGYSQLRLRGFYDDANKKVKAAFDAKISTLDEYIHEYCNFGCAYFVVKKVKTPAGLLVEHESEGVEAEELEEVLSSQTNASEENNNATHPTVTREGKTSGDKGVGHQLERTHTSPHQKGQSNGRKSSKYPSPQRPSKQGYKGRQSKYKNQQGAADNPTGHMQG